MPLGSSMTGWLCKPCSPDSDRALRTHGKRSLLIHQRRPVPILTDFPCIPALSCQEWPGFVHRLPFRGGSERSSFQLSRSPENGNSLATGPIHFILRNSPRFRGAREWIPSCSLPSQVRIRASPGCPKNDRVIAFLKESGTMDIESVSGSERRGTACGVFFRH